MSIKLSSGADVLSCCPLSPASGVLAVGGGDAPCIGPGLVTSSLSRSGALGDAGAGTFCVVPPPGSAITWFRMSGSSIEGCDGMGRIVPTGPAITWFSKADGSGSGGAGGGGGLCTTGLTFGAGSACTWVGCCGSCLSEPGAARGGCIAAHGMATNWLTLK